MSEFNLLPKYSPKTESGLITVLIFSAIAGCATMGYDSMMMSSLIAVDQFANYFNINPVTTGLLNAGVWVGQIVACFPLAFITDYFGRKKTILLSTILNFIAIIIQTASQNIAMFVIARFLLGIGIILSCTAGPILLAELAPPNKRGWIVGLYFTMFNAGAIIASAVTYGTVNIPNTWTWRVPSVLQAVPSILVVSLLAFIPESPRWKIHQGDFEYSKQVFQIFEKDADVVDQLVEDIVVSVEIETKSNRNSWSELFSMTKPMIRRLIIGITLVWIVEMGGSSVGSYYLTILLKQAGIVGSSKLLQINMISSCWNFIVSVVASFLFDKLGRKNQSLISLTGMIVCFLCLGGFIKKFNSGDVVNKSGQYATIFWMFLFNGFYSFCFTPLTDIYITEIFPNRVRASGISVIRFFDSGFGLLASFILPIAMNSVGWKFYIINACYDVLFLPVIYFVWVETKNLSLEEISIKLGDVVIKHEVIDAANSDAEDLNVKVLSKEDSDV